MATTWHLTQVRVKINKFLKVNTLEAKKTYNSFIESVHEHLPINRDRDRYMMIIEPQHDKTNNVVARQ